MTEADLSALSVSEFLDRLASGDPTPGGGSAAALAGALAASLVSMVCNLTLGREKFATAEEAVRGILGRSEDLRSALREGVQADAAAYGALMAAYRLPRGTEAEQARRGETVQAATREAARVPLATAEQCAGVLDLCEEALPITNPNVASDVAVAALLAGTGLEAAAANVEANLASIKDRRYAEDLRGRLAGLRAGREGRPARIAREAGHADTG